MLNSMRVKVGLPMVSLTAARAGLLAAAVTLAVVMVLPVFAVTGVSITSPIEASPASTTAPGYVEVAFTFVPAATSTDVDIEIYKGTTVIGTKTINYATTATSTDKSASVYITAAAEDGSYDVSVSVDDGVAVLGATEVDAVIIDTVAPTVTIDADPWINGVATATSTIIVTFSKPMATSTTPTITFDPDLAGTLDLDTDSWSGDGKVYTAIFDITDNDDEETDVDVSVGGAVDPAGNPQDPDPTIAEDLFDVDQVEPEFGSIEWNDVDGSRGISAGDTLLFTFSEDMDPATVTDANLDTDLELSDGSYGTDATVDWATPAGDDTLTVTLGAAVSILGDGSVTVAPPATVTDPAGNPSAETVAILDELGPKLVSITWWDLDASTTINAEDELVFVFGEDMNTGTVTSGNVATTLPLSAGSYGTTGLAVAWESAPTGQLTLTLGTGASILLSDTVDPADSVQDVAGNDDATAPGTSIVQGVIVSIDAPATVLPGAAIAADLTITNVTDLDAGNFAVTFNRHVLELTSVTNGEIGGSVIPVAAYSLDNPVASSTSTVTVAVNVPGAPGVTGEGTLAVLNFTFIGFSGEDSDLDLTEGTLSDKTAQAVNAQWVDPTFPTVGATKVVGDANGDGSVDIFDITRIEIDIAAGLGLWTVPESKVSPILRLNAAPGADANVDSAINALDITRTELLVAGG